MKFKPWGLKGNFIIHPTRYLDLNTDTDRRGNKIVYNYFFVYFMKLIHSLYLFSKINLYQQTQLIFMVGEAHISKRPIRGAYLFSRRFDWSPPPLDYALP